ncbi:MAG: OmpA family protein [Casimicrobiaceae bacterium]
MNAPSAMDGDQARVDRFNLWVALFLALILVLLWLFGRGPSAACCMASSAASAAATAAGVQATQTAPLAVEATSPVATAPIEAMLGVDGKLVLSGTVADEPTRRALVDAAQARHGAANVIDELRIGAPAAQTLRLSGEVADTATRTAWGEAFSAALAARSPAWAVDNALTVKAQPVAASAPPRAVIYFATGKADVSAEAREKVGEVITYLRANPERKAVISGYHDPRGNKAANEELAKNRAKSIRELLRAAGFEEARIELRKPVETTGSGSLAEARRVELTVE